MPGHGYVGRKFGRKRDPRRALLKGLASQLIEAGEIKTTQAKAKSLRPYVERLITKARRGDLHQRRQIISKLATPRSAHILVDKIAPQVKRPGGYLRITPLESRQGDNAPMALLTFVDFEKTHQEPTKTTKENSVKVASNA